MTITKARRVRGKPGVARPARRLSLWARLRRQWGRVHGSVYAIRGEHPATGRVCCVYVGKYAGPWEERVRQHLYGGGKYGKPAQLWAVTVPGYDRNARTLKAQKLAVKAIIENGDAYLVWEGDCFYWWLTRRESWAFIGLRPCYNIQGNTHRSSHIPKWEVESYMAARAARRAAWNRRATGVRVSGCRVVGRYGVPLEGLVSGPDRYVVPWARADVRACQEMFGSSGSTERLR